MTYISLYTETRESLYYVTPYKDGWAVKHRNYHLVAYMYKDKKKAISAGKFLAKKNHSELVIKKPDGTIQETISYKD
jgi:hypothetical protein